MQCYDRPFITTFWNQLRKRLWKNRTSSQLFKLDFVRGIKYLKGLHLLRKNTKNKQRNSNINKKRKIKNDRFFISNGLIKAKLLQEKISYSFQKKTNLLKLLINKHNLIFQHKKQCIENCNCGVITAIPGTTFNF